MNPFPLTDYCILVYARFLQHFALGSMGQEPILYDHLGVLFPSAELRNSANSQGDKVRILTKVQWFLLILCSVDYTIQLWCGIIFNVWKGCHYHHHWIAGKPQGETLQLPGPVEQGTWKVIFLTKLIWFVSCVKIFSLTYTYLLIIMRRRITQTKIIQLYYYFIRRWVVYQPGPDSCDSFSASHLQQFLSSFLESQGGPGGKPHLLVLSPG